jgi:glutathionyl-hydroquinone reductase
LKRARSEYIDKKIPLPNWYDERLYQAIFSQANNSVSKRLTQLRNAYTKISMNKELDLKTKTKKQKEIQELINKTYIDWNNAMYRAGVPNKKY